VVQAARLNYHSFPRPRNPFARPGCVFLGNRGQRCLGKLIWSRKASSAIPPATKKVTQAPSASAGWLHPALALGACVIPAVVNIFVAGVIHAGHVADPLTAPQPVYGCDELLGPNKFGLVIREEWFNGNGERRTNGR